MKLDRIILEQLDACGSYLLPQSQLLSLVNLALPTGHRVALAEMERALTGLEAERHVTGQRHPDKGLMWKITPDGKARLAL